MTEDNLVPDDDVASKPDAVVIIEDKKPEQKSDKTVVPEQKDAATEGVEALAKNLEKVTKEKEESSRRALNAESRAHEAETRAATAESRISSQTQQNIDANRTAASNAIDAAKAKRDQAKKDYIALQAEGKFEEAFEATQVAAQAANEINHAEGYLRNLDATVERMKSEPVRTQPKSDSSGTVDPVTGIKFTPKTFEWIQSQGENWKDQDFRVACDAASRAAKRKGLAADTDEYNNYIDNHLVNMGFKEGSTEVDDVEQELKPKPVTRRAGGAPSAAPTRAVQGTTGVAAKGIKLSGAQRDATAAILESLPDWFPKGTNADQVAAKSIKEAAASGEQWAIDQLANSR